MKHFYLVISLFLLTRAAAAQTSNHLDEIAQKSCSCVTADEMAQSTIEALQAKFGACIVKEALAYKAPLKAENGLDMDAMDYETGKKLGQLVAVRMLNYCPEVLMKLGMKAKNAAPAVLQKQGTIQSITAGDFATLKLQAEDKLITKYLWLTNFPGANELSQLKAPNGTKVTLDYEVVEFYDPRIKEYRNFNVIKGCKILP